MGKRIWQLLLSRQDKKKEQKSVGGNQHNMMNLSLSLSLTLSQYDAQVQLLKEELSRKEVAAQRRVDRVQKECQAVRNEMKGHISNKLKLDSELEQLRSVRFTSSPNQTYFLLHSISTTQHLPTFPSTQHIHFFLPLSFLCLKLSLSLSLSLSENFSRRMKVHMIFYTHTMMN